MLDVDSGAMATYGHDAFDTAGFVKADILASLLLQAQDQGRRLSTEERAQSAAMSQKSENESTSTVWGITQTTAEDQIRLFQSVFSDKPPLSEASRESAAAFSRKLGEKSTT
ncbi:hypothetical protein [Streptomyces tendae]|uniref:hypothetical protein n=1 Tax=Streptomyces tendae TaxID=1932 RepID=UPI0037F4E4E4